MDQNIFGTISRISSQKWTESGNPLCTDKSLCESQTAVTTSSSEITLSKIITKTKRMAYSVETICRSTLDVTHYKLQCALITKCSTQLSSEYEHSKTTCSKRDFKLTNV